MRVSVTRLKPIFLNPQISPPSPASLPSALAGAGQDIALRQLEFAPFPPGPGPDGHRESASTPPRAQGYGMCGAGRSSVVFVDLVGRRCSAERVWEQQSRSVRILTPDLLIAA